MSATISADDWKEIRELVGESATKVSEHATRNRATVSETLSRQCLERHEQSAKALFGDGSSGVVSKQATHGAQINDLQRQLAAVPKLTIQVTEMGVALRNGEIAVNKLSAEVTALVVEIRKKQSLPPPPLAPPVPAAMRSDPEASAAGKKLAQSLIGLAILLVGYLSRFLSELN